MYVDDRCISCWKCGTSIDTKVSVMFVFVVENSGATDPSVSFLGNDQCISLHVYSWESKVPPPKLPPPQEIAGLIKGLLTIGFP